ncbi:MAG TPA: hypothetical protein VFG50_10360, partial [Rhodothermales bacterium]|nr:hypothetical protein [Rhodothermales bacterium]
MRRPAIVRLQLLALGVIVVLVVVRALSGPPAPEGLLVLTDIEPHQLQHEAFALDRPARLAVEAVGSFEAPRGLAAYGWILNRDDGQVAWVMQPGAATHERGTLAHVRDTLTLEPGTYDVYYASFGNTPENGRGHSFLSRVRHSDEPWQRDADRWMLALRSADGATRELRRVSRDENDADARVRGAAVWAAEPIGDDQKRSYVFQVDRPVRLEIDATGEFGGGPADYGWIEDAVTGERKWEMTAANTTPAGGSSLNRRFQGEVRLEPGLYRAVYETDARHAYDDWAANPPSNPLSWGMSLTGASPEDARAVRAFDPWTARAPLVSMLRVPSSTKRTAEFEVSEPMAVVVDALGEIAHGDRFDYGWLEKQDGQRVWEMSVERARPAGGGEKNQEEMAFLKLEPGAYQLVYQTDGSHAYDDWNTEPPPHPDRWGIALFPVAAGASPDAVQVTSETTTSTDDEEMDPSHMPPMPPQPPLPAMSAPVGDVLVDQRRLGNEANVQIPFRLTEPTKLHIRA